MHFIVSYFHDSNKAMICSANIETVRQYRGVASSLWHVILGRVIAGIGGGGMVSLVSVIVTGIARDAGMEIVFDTDTSTQFDIDFASPGQVAVLRGYISAVSTAGRSSGGPLGGLLTDTVGWRWLVRLKRTPSSVWQD